MKIVLVGADVSNLYYNVGKKYEGKKLNYKKFLAAALGEDTLYRAFAYGSQIDNEAARFIHYLKCVGFETKYCKTFPSQRINWNVEIVLDIVKVVEKLDVVVLGTNNIELLPLITWLQSHGVKVVILASNIPSLLKDNVDSWKEIGQDLLEGSVSEPNLNDKMLIFIDKQLQNLVEVEDD